MEKAIIRADNKNGIIIPFEVNPVLDITHIIAIFLSGENKNYKFEGEWHDFWEFIYIEKGEMLITAGESKYILKAGELAFHCPNEFHAVESCTDDASVYIVASFVSDSSCMSYFERKILTLNGQEREMLYMALNLGKSVFPKFIRVNPDTLRVYNFDNTPYGAEQMIRNYLENMLLHLYQRKNGNNAKTRMATYAKKIRDKKLSADVDEYLRNHLGGMLKLKELSASLGYCVSQIQKVFREETGQSVMDYYIDLKITRAKQLMREGDYNFTQIAAMLGYDNVNYFSRLFKIRTGITLTEYAKSEN